MLEYVGTRRSLSGNTMVYLMITLTCLIIVHLSKVIDGVDGSITSITRNTGQSFDELLCPIDKVVDVTSVHAGSLPDPVVPSSGGCVVEITSDAFSNQYRQVTEACNGRSACRLFVVPAPPVKCLDLTDPFRFMTIGYRCIDPPFFKTSGLRPQSHCLKSDEFFHRSLCPIGSHIEVYDVYLGMFMDQSEQCLGSRDCLYATPRDQELDFIRESCDGRLACVNDIRAYTWWHTCGVSDYMVVQYSCQSAHLGDLQSVVSAVNAPITDVVCPFGSTILMHDGYSLANTTDTPPEGILPTYCVRSLYVPDVVAVCDGRTACSGLVLAADNVRCPILHQSASLVILLYSCQHTESEIPSTSARNPDRGDTITTAVSTSVLESTPFTPNVTEAPGQSSTNQTVIPIWWYLAGAGGLLLLPGIVVCIVLVRKRKRSSPNAPYLNNKQDASDRPLPEPPIDDGYLTPVNRDVTKPPEGAYHDITHVAPVTDFARDTYLTFPEDEGPVYTEIQE